MYIVLFRTIIIYVLIIICLRIMGKRQLGELQPSEFVIAILISNIATISIEDTDIPLLSAIVPIVTLMSSEVLLSAVAMKSNKAQVVISGNPVVIIRNGTIDQARMRELRFSIEDLMSQLRINGIFDIREVGWAIVETNGKLTVYPKYYARPVTAEMLALPAKANENTPPLVVISDGVLMPETLEICGLGQAWLDRVLKENQVTPEKVFLMTCDSSETYYLVKKETDPKWEE